MNSRDHKLGMDRAITRRDFINGVSVAIGASLVPACARERDPAAAGPPAMYPPGRTGMRGSHPGSFENAHATVQGRRWAVGTPDEHYDLVVAGAGISGLTAAYLYRRDVNPDARILVLDNHDDFGGHAKRNEFTLDGRKFIGFGGTMFIEAPHTYPAVSKQVLRELGIDVRRSAEFYHDDLFRALGLGEVSFFDKETYGADVLATGAHGFGDSLAKLPVSAAGKADLERLFADEVDYLEGMTGYERRAALASHSWLGYLETFGGFGAEVLAYVQKMPHGYWAIGADALPAWMAQDSGYPGFGGVTGGGEGEGGDEDEIRGFWFPDGNASVARLLARKLVPDAAPGHSMQDIVTAQFDYSRLDRDGSPTRIRLSSTVVDLRHREGALDADVEVTYVHDDEPRTVSAGKVIWAGYHAMLPYICADIPAQQVAALRSSVRAPLVYTNVLIRNWQSLAKLGMRRAYCPGSFFQAVMFTHPVSIGDYYFTRSPDEPVILHLQHIPLSPGLSAPEQFRAGRRFLLDTPFETFERNLRDQLGRMLGPGGFDPARDIAGITVNRWSHGYAYSIDAETGDVAWSPDEWHHENRPWVTARQRVGNIAFANTDAASNAMTESAIEEAHRAVHSLM